MIDTWLTRELGLAVPIIGAPMGGRSGGELAGAVSAAGGLGMLGAARYTDADWLARESGKARRIGTKFGIGLMTWSLGEDDDLLVAAIAAKPDLISLSFGDPAPYVDRILLAGIPVAAQVQTLEDLKMAERAGIDLVIAQGGEAGGHTGRIGTLPLLQEVLENTSLPVVAAGGIATGRGLAAVLAAGAEGALVGTALLASPEADGPEFAKQRVLAARSADTVYTSVFDVARQQPWPDRWGGRAIRNTFSDRWHTGEVTGAEHLPPDADAMAADYDPADPDLGVVYAGQAAGLVTEPRAAGKVVHAIASQAEDLLARFR
ncbi:MAG: nitronate monooxygenase [Mycobacteriaceae bacterium]|nr:nitronate monooxygenase [Mycobacteriaceae bacterium]